VDEVTIALAIHVLAIVLWIGGVAMVTTVLLPALSRRPNPREAFALFVTLESGFAWQARLSTVFAGASGVYMATRLDFWPLFLTWNGWWLDAMVLVWLLFTLMLFVAEPLFLHRWLMQRADRDPAGTLALVRALHRVLLTLSLITVAGATLGSHGVSFGG
jgi:uncharacterized membrane protein